MATVPEISQLVIEETLEWQKPAIRDVFCEFVDIELSLPLVDNLLIEWDSEIKDSINPFFSFGGL